MHSANPWKSYRQVAAQTAPPGHLVLMLYDGALRFLNLALTGFNREDPLEFNQTINNNILRALDIVAELDSSLNMEAGGELAAHLRRVYSYVEWRLTESNFRKQPEGIREAIARLTTLREAWAAMLGVSAEPAVNAAAAARPTLECALA